jgi:hypothetical protein
MKSKLFFFSRAPAILLLYYTKNYHAKLLYFLKIVYKTSLYDTTASGAVVDPTSQVCSSTMLALPSLENREVQF